MVDASGDLRPSNDVVIRNYLKIACRNLLRHKTYTFINILGLAVGIACCLLIVLYIQDELSYDRYHEKADQIYRVVEQMSSKGIEDTYAMVPWPTGPALREAFPGVLSAVRFFNESSQHPVLAYRDRRFTEKRFFFADSTIFEIFSFQLVRGNPQTALAEPFSIILTEETAHKYFGEEDPIGKIITYVGPGHEFKVTGVLQNIPRTSHFQFDLLASFEGLSNVFATRWNMTFDDDWEWKAFPTYLLLRGDQNPTVLEQQLPGFVATYFDEAQRQGVELQLQRLTAIHLHSHFESELEANGNMAYLYLFGSIALFIVVLACINFTNLATARAIERAREVGIRKVMGAYRRQLILQFLGESVFLCFLAVLLAMVFVELSLPVINRFAGKELAVHYFENSLVLPGLTGLVLCVGLLAGSYPAFVLSAFQPVSVLKGGVAGRSVRATLQKGLVVFQFAGSIVLLMGIAVVHQQRRYIGDKEVGFTKEQVVVIDVPRPVRSRYSEAFKSELLAHTHVLGVTTALEMPGPGVGYMLDVRPEGRDEVVYFPTLNVDEDFIDVFGLEVIEGTVSLKDHTADRFVLLLNEAAAKTLEWDTPIGKRLAFEFSDEVYQSPVVGVVKDFHFESFHHRIQPLILRVFRQDAGFRRKLAVRIRPEDIAGTLTFLESKWHGLAPEYPLEYTFLDETLAQQYQAERRLETLGGTFTLLAILIACLGLFGLASFTTLQRTKEIGLRKVLGASTEQVVLLVSTDFIKLVVIAFLVAAPVAYLVMTRWLETFAHRVDVSLATFVLAGFIVFVLACLTVCYQSIKAALTNPVETLRYE